MGHARNYYVHQLLLKDSQLYLRNCPHSQRTFDLIQELVPESNIAPPYEGLELKYYCQAEIASNDSGELTIDFLRSRSEVGRQLQTVSQLEETVLRA